MKLRRSAAHRLCKVIGNARCACEERGDPRPCASLVPYLRAGGGDPDRAAEVYAEVRGKMQRVGEGEQ